MMTELTRVRVSVVVPSVQEKMPTALGDALESQTLRPCEIIHVYDAERRGAAWARNIGIEQAFGNVIACVDDDCIPPANWLDEICMAMSRFGADVVGGTYEEHDSFLRARRHRQQFPSDTGPDNEGKVGAGGNIAYRSDTLKQLKARDGYVFNEAFRMSQDWELMWRLRDLGAEVVFLATPVQHLKRLGAFSYLKQQFLRGIGIAGLDQARKRLGGSVVTHKSLLWDDPDTPLWKKRLKIFWRKGIGPFDAQSFSSAKQFILFWTGEKVQAIGYVWGKSRGLTQS